MKVFRIPIALAIIVVPILLRTIWFYQGVYVRSTAVPTPDYGSFQIPAPPLSTALPEPKLADGDGQIILIDQAHANNFTLTDIEALSKKMVERGARVEPVEPISFMGESSLEWKLKYATAYITVAPMVPFSSQEAQLLRVFVEHGGRLLVITDPTRTIVATDSFGYSSYTISDIEAANMLLAPYDLAFSGDYLFNMTENEGNFQNVYFQTFSKSPLTNGLAKVVLYVTHSITTKTGALLMMSGEKTQSTRTGSGSGLASAAMDASGSVVAIGDLTFLTPPYNQVADNPVFIDHITDYLLSAPKIHDLTDFPYVFTKPVTIVPAKDVNLTTDLFSPLHALQTALESAGRKTTLGTQPEDGKDLIWLETYSSEGVAQLVEPFRIILPNLENPNPGDDSSKIRLPGMGAIAPSGTGLILFTRDSNRSTIILIAEDVSALTDLLNILGSEGFRSCMVQGNIGVCPTHSSGSNAMWDLMYGGGFSNPTAGPADIRVAPTPTPTKQAG
jgi:hypothetical protein